MENIVSKPVHAKVYFPGMNGIKWWDIFAFDQLAIGALCAYIFINKKDKILSFIYNQHFRIILQIRLELFPETKGKI